jgi:hypothetical protein
LVAPHENESPTTTNISPDQKSFWLLIFTRISSAVVGAF